jgi:hypothetical protein
MGAIAGSDSERARLASRLSGQMKARQRRGISEQLANHTADTKPLLVVGTGSFIGEGFDCPTLDTLFLAPMPPLPRKGPYFG